MKKNTSLIRMGQNFDPVSRAIIPPPCMTSTYVQESPGVSQYEYGRTDNPSFRNLEAGLTAIESEAVDAVVFSSGSGAINAIVQLLKNGDHILCDDNTYSGTRRLFTQCYEQFGIQTSFVSARDLEKFESAILPNTRLIWIETPTNPLLNINDIKAIAQLAKKRSIMFGVDSTFATPLNQSPLVAGADLVLYSTTKYIAGHSDVIGGAITSNNQELIDRLRWRRNALGLNPSPFDCWLIQRGMKTLALRMERHEYNAKEFALWIQSKKSVKRVIYPGISSFPQFELAQKQMTGFSGIISVEFNLKSQEIIDALMRLKLWNLAESLGGVESLVDYPWYMTQSGLSPEERKVSQIPEGLVRFSIGIESVEDLIEDVEKAFLIG